MWGFFGGATEEPESDTSVKKPAAGAGGGRSAKPSKPGLSPDTKKLNVGRRSVRPSINVELTPPRMSSRRITVGQGPKAKPKLSETHINEFLFGSPTVTAPKKPAAKKGKAPMKFNMSYEDDASNSDDDKPRRPSTESKGGKPGKAGGKGGRPAAGMRPTVSKLPSRPLPKGKAPPKAKHALSSESSSDELMGMKGGRKAKQPMLPMMSSSDEDLGMKVVKRKAKQPPPMMPKKPGMQELPKKPAMMAVRDSLSSGSSEDLGHPPPQLGQKSFEGAKDEPKRPMEQHMGEEVAMSAMAAMAPDIPGFAHHPGLTPRLSLVQQLSMQSPPLHGLAHRLSMQSPPHGLLQQLSMQPTPRNLLQQLSMQPPIAGLAQQPSMQPTPSSLLHQLSMQPPIAGLEKQRMSIAQIGLGQQLGGPGTPLGLGQQISMSIPQFHLGQELGVPAAQSGLGHELGALLDTDYENFPNIPLTSEVPEMRSGLLGLMTGDTDEFKEMEQGLKKTAGEATLVPKQYVMRRKTKEELMALTRDLDWVEFFRYGDRAAA